MARDMVAYSFRTAGKLCDLSARSIKRATQRDPGPGQLRVSHYGRVPRQELIRWMHSGHATVPRAKKPEDAPKKRKRFPRINP